MYITKIISIILFLMLFLIDLSALKILKHFLVNIHVHSMSSYVI